MSTFFRYLLSFAMQMAWRRAGKGGAIPPVRLPGKGKPPINLPLIGPWQMMAATWVLKRVWGRYGSQITSHLQNNANDLTRRAAKFIPNPQTAGSSASKATSGSAATNSATSPRTPTPAVPQSAPRPAPNFNTQVLSDSDASSHINSPVVNSPVADATNTTLPQGSILGKLRGR